MTLIPDAYKKVPMMFRAQVNGRCQLHRIVPEKKKAGQKQDVQFWAEEWVKKAAFVPAKEQQDVQTETYQTKTYQISWRFVTNGGQDDGMIRPVIGAYGIPFYPGSRMKGAFRRACELAEQAGELQYSTCNDYCGDESEIIPGRLRFQGAYPTNDWTKNLVDMVHPQPKWQVKTYETNDKRATGESAYAQVSLYQPILRFGISSIQPLSPEQWQEVWRVWEQAIGVGLGTRVCAGYGQIEATHNSVIYQVRLKGQGQAAKLIDDTGEFRPNIFRATLRSHALRIFGGLTNEERAEQLVEELFGGVRGKGTVGLLGLGFQTAHLELGTFGQNGYEQPTYQVEGDVIWSLTRPLPNEEQTTALQNLVTDLMCFAMVLGGFGKSWRRADHRLFYDNDDYEKLIGCHWQWAGEVEQKNALRVWNPKKVGGFIDSVLETAKAWMQLRGAIPNPDNHADWREAWHPSRVQVWGRISQTRDECQAIYWLHKPYQKGISIGERDKSIKTTSVTGFVESSRYLRELQLEKAKKLLDRYDYFGVKEVFSSYLKPEEQKLLEAAIKWNHAEFQKFTDELKDCSNQKLKQEAQERAKEENWWWSAYESAYLAVVRLEQKNTVEAMFHSFRAVEWVIGYWSMQEYPDDIENRKGKPVAILRSPSNLPQYLIEQLKESKNNEMALYGEGLFKLLRESKTEFKEDNDMKVIWKSAKSKRNDQFHQLLGLDEKEVFQAWGMSSQPSWETRLLNCLKLITNQSHFTSIKKASLMAQVHEELDKAIAFYL